MTSGSPARRAARAAGVLTSLSGPARVRLLNVTLVLLNLLLLVSLSRRSGGLGVLDAPLAWWLLAPLYGLAELFVIHLQFRRNAYSFAVGEVALVLGLVFATPGQLVLAQLLGVGCVLVVHRRQSALKLTFNLAQLAFTTLLAVHLFRLLAGPGTAAGADLWLAAFLSVGLVTVGTVVMIFLAISLVERSPQLSGIPSALAAAGVLTVANGSLGVVSVVLVQSSPAAAALLLIPVMLIFATYRAYVAERANHERLDFLYRTTHAVSSATAIEEAVHGLLTQVREMFRADIAELALISADPLEPALHTTLGPGDASSVMEPATTTPAELPPDSDFLLLSAPADPAEVARHLPGRAAKDAMVVALLASDGRTLGRLTVGERYGDVATFDQADLQLFRTLAAQASLALENGRLEKSLDQLGRLKEQLRHDATHDPLTGLANRALLHASIEEALESAAGDGRTVVGLLLDLDDFKTVNDSLGHHAGDDLLVEVATRLSACLSGHDLAARLGGDEFAVLLHPGATLATAVDVASRLLAALQHPVVVADRTTTVQASIGIAELDAGDASHLLRNADTAMYSAKQDGKGRYRLFEDGMHTDALRRLELRGALEHAADRGELRLVYQPLVDLVTGEVLEAEALLRWEHPQLGFLPPDQFIGIAEQTGLIVPVGRWVLQTALHQLATWRRTVPGAEHLRLSVNLSARQLSSTSLVHDVATALRGCGLPADSLTLEITESVLMTNSDAALRVLTGLKGLGTGIAIDDFGTGYSSLAYLRSFPVDVLKLDKSFVDDLSTDGGHALVGAIAGLAGALRMRTVAEGIEHRDQADRLRALRYDTGQGYHFSRPVPAEQLAELLVEQPFRRGLPGPRVPLAAAR